LSANWFYGSGALPGRRFGAGLQNPFFRPAAAVWWAGVWVFFCGCFLWVFGFWVLWVLGGCFVDFGWCFLGGSFFGLLFLL